MKRKSSKSGFTLIELLTVMAIISILMVILVPRVIEAQDKSKVVGCQANLMEIYKGIIALDSRQGSDVHVVDEPGVRYFLKIWKYTEWDHTEGAAKKLTCPGVKVSNLAGLKGRAHEHWFDDWDALNGSYSAYAGRDIKAHPMKKITSEEPLVADDNDGGMNHRNTTNVLMGEGNVKSLDLIFLQQDGVISKDVKVLKVGPESPVELLRKFSLD